MKGVGDRLDLSFEVQVASGIGVKPPPVPFASLVTGPTVVSIFMRTNTGSCDKQNHALVADAAKIRERGYHLMALSRDRVGALSRYAEKLGIDYTLVSDPKDKFGEAADAIVEKKMCGHVFDGPQRSAWVIDAQGLVLAVIEKVEAARHGEQVLATLDTL